MQTTDSSEQCFSVSLKHSQHYLALYGNLKIVFAKLLEQIDLMHHDVIRPKGSMVVVVTLKSKMAAGSTSSGGYSKSAGSLIRLPSRSQNESKDSTNAVPKQALLVENGPAASTGEHLSSQSSSHQLSNIQLLKRKEMILKMDIDAVIQVILETCKISSNNVIRMENRGYMVTWSFAVRQEMRLLHLFLMMKLLKKLKSGMSIKG